MAKKKVAFYQDVETFVISSGHPWVEHVRRSSSAFVDSGSGLTVNRCVEERERNKERDSPRQADNAGVSSFHGPS
jgi:hypothetical protein